MAERLKPPYDTADGLICSCVRDALPLVEYRFAKAGWIEKDFSGLISQWGYKNNAVDASSTTHNRGGVFDVRYVLVNTDAKLKVWQECGFVPERRRRPQWSLSKHGHILVNGCDHLDPLADRQVADFRNGENGLGGVDNHTPYDGPIYVHRTWQQAQRIYADLIEEMDMPTAKEVAKAFAEELKHNDALLDAIAIRTRDHLFNDKVLQTWHPNGKGGKWPLQALLRSIRQDTDANRKALAKAVGEKVPPPPADLAEFEADEPA